MRRVVAYAWSVLLLVGMAQGLVISEIRVDQPSSDTDEYFELLGAPGLSLSNLSYVVIGDSLTNSGVIECAVDLSGLVIPEDAYLVVGEASFSLTVGLDATNSLNFENSDNVTHLLVEGFSAANGDDLDLDDDGHLDLLPWTRIVDAVALIEDTNRPPSGTEWEYASDLGFPVVGPEGSGAPAHIRRNELSDFQWELAAPDPLDNQDSPGAHNVDVPRAQLTRVTTAGTGGPTLRVRTPPIRATNTIETTTNLHGTVNWSPGPGFESAGEEVDIPVAASPGSDCMFYRVVTKY